MGWLDNEDNIVAKMREVIALYNSWTLLTRNNFEKRIFNAVTKKWSKWSVNNSHSAEPPDYFSQSLKLMFDVMRINDSETMITTKRGKTRPYNPILKKEREQIRELKKYFPNVAEENILVNVEPDGDYDKTHNYQNYYRHAQKVFSAHIGRIPRCRELHPGFKMGFLVMDETESYLQHKHIGDAVTPFDTNKIYQVLSTPHIPFLDERFMRCLIASDLDFLIWFMPYKHNEKMAVQPPEVCFIDLKNKKTQTYLRQYPEFLMRRM